MRSVTRQFKRDRGQGRLAQPGAARARPHPPARGAETTAAIVVRRVLAVAGLLLALLGCSTNNDAGRSERRSTSPGRAKVTTTRKPTTTAEAAPTSGTSPPTAPTSLPTTVAPTTSTSSTTTTIPATVAPPTQSTLPPSSAPPDIGGRATAAAKVTSLGWDSDTEVGSFAPGYLSAFGAHHQGSINGRCDYVFFFLGDRYLGTDVASCSELSRAVSSDGGTVRVEYPLYRDNDAGCCPSGGSAFVRFHWNGQRLAPLDPIPPLTGPLRRCLACQ